MAIWTGEAGNAAWRHSAAVISTDALKSSSRLLEHSRGMPATCAWGKGASDFVAVCSCQGPRCRVCTRDSNWLAAAHISLHAATYSVVRWVPRLVAMVATSHHGPTVSY